MLFQEYLYDIDFLSLYNNKILPKKGGGRDNISPETYKPIFEKELDWITEKLIDGSYKFSPYKEKLILKGRNKFPRVLSIPSVRDRFVLCLLNGYLSSQLGISYMIPNLYIRKITDYIQETRNADEEIYFFKTDISSFYDNINQSVLINILTDKIDGVALKLVVRAITTPTITQASEANKVNCKGVPQGLAISNILAAIYVQGFQKDIERRIGEGLFLRYVDDILVLSRHSEDFRKIIVDGIERYNLGLELTESKTMDGHIADGFDYIGYKIKGNLISVKKKNKDNFSNRLVKKCTLLRKQFEDSSLRPRFTTEDQEFLDYAETDLNLMISGFKVGNHNYGWISFFQKINDLTILYQFDSLVRKMLGKDFVGKISVNSIVRTYFGLLEKSGDGFVTDFDKVIGRGERIAYLRRFGYIRRSDEYDISNEEVERLFIRMVSRFQKHSEMDIAETS